MSTQTPTSQLDRSGLVIVDKPAGMTSHDVVGRLRRIFGTRKVGHAGTLDPMATGVLVAGIERGTKFLAHMVTSTKAYTATIRLGQATSTDDAEGEVTATATTAQVAALTMEQVQEQIQALTGDILQRPAQVSAIKIAGKRAHQRVRDGEEVDIPARPVTVNRFEVLEHRLTGDFLDLDVVVECSSGTYIRALARDLGQALGVGGHLTALRRTEVGPFQLADAATLDTLADLPQLSLTLDAALARCYPHLQVTQEEAAALAMGKWLEPRGLVGVHAALAPDGQAVALVKEQGKRLATVFVARPSTLS
ncbi:tRNA pseudouridine(55) synthase TruB [Corynebacterium lizhenjunii]|uniref:tRNA pseudouridine synthase B n=1 Tax=Corynebacterium lizhenjunii TaxID=2709394 RepID=A0A7T0P9X0_9CORY|nr:tRNA pseudouridine(55) synthase TruB [Corynebacterium lizhenjunii]QPK78391.1 tRNA pseudouridine(55) synthase TruB [Corynebacterium lizhenjunii]